MSFALVAVLFWSQVLVPSSHAFAPLGNRASTRTTTSQSSFLHARQSTSLSWALFPSDETETSEATKVVETKGMPDLVSFLQPSGVKEPNSVPAKTSSTTIDGLTEFDGETQDSLSFATVFSVAALLGGSILWAAGHSLGLSVDDVTSTAAALVQHPQQTLATLIEDIKDMGPTAPLFFGLLYTIAEILAVPATPLTLSAGYLFGLYQGVGVVLASGTIAACVGFAIGKTALRGAVEGLLESNPEFRKLDKAIGKEGFKLLVLVRLTPLFPFAISNYIYGASAIKFWPYFWGTLLGFAPGTFAYVYTGMVGQAVMTGQGDQPWYYYVGGLAGLTILLKVITDTATDIVRTMEEDMED